MPSSPRRLYLDAVRYYQKPQWDRPRLLSKRLRSVLRLIALEERLQELNAGALPPQVMLTLRMLSGYKNATSVRYYQHRFRRPQYRDPSDNPLWTPPDDASSGEAP